MQSWMHFAALAVAVSAVAATTASRGDARRRFGER